jgi:hypothetical protein
MDIEHYGPHLKMGDKLGARHYRGSMVVSFTLNPIKVLNRSVLWDFFFLKRIPNKGKILSQFYTWEFFPKCSKMAITCALYIF